MGVITVTAYKRKRDRLARRPASSPPTILDDILDMFGSDMVYLHRYNDQAYATDTATDYTGNGHGGDYGNIANSPTRTGVDGKQYPILDGVNTDSITLSDATDLSVTTTVSKTLFQLVYPSDSTAFTLYDKRNGGADWEYRGLLNAHDGGSPGNFKTLYDTYSTPGGAIVARYTGNSFDVPVNQWTLLAQVINAYSGTATNHSFYKNGSSHAATKTTFTNAAAWNTASPFRHGLSTATSSATGGHGSLAYTGMITNARNATEMSDLAQVFRDRSWIA